MMKLVEESSGLGELMMNGVTVCEVRYRVTRFQGMMEDSGLPIPGVHRIEGSVEFGGHDPREWIGVPVSLKLQDGKLLGITLVDMEGRILSEGHGPSKCLCC